MPTSNTTLPLPDDAQINLAVTLRTLRQLEDRLYATGLTKVQSSLLGHMSHHRRMLWIWVNEENAATRGSAGSPTAPVAEPAVAEPVEATTQPDNIALTAAYLEGGVDALNLLAKEQASAEQTPATTAAYLRGLNDAFTLIYQDLDNDEEDETEED